jgi:hypothetical protein
MSAWSIHVQEAISSHWLPASTNKLLNDPPSCSAPPFVLGLTTADCQMREESYRWHVAHGTKHDCLCALSKLPFQLRKTALQSHILLLQFRIMLLQLRVLLLQLLLHLLCRIQARLPANIAGHLATASANLLPNIWPLRRLQACTASDKTQAQL